MQIAVDRRSQMNHRPAWTPDPSLDVFGIRMSRVGQNKFGHLVEEEASNIRRKFQRFTPLRLFKERICHAGCNHSITQQAGEFPKASLTIALSQGCVA